MLMNFIRETHSMKCLSCQSSHLEVALDFGEQYVAGFYDTIDVDAPKGKLTLVQCQHCFLVQLTEIIDQNLLYREYWYRSSTNAYMVRALQNVVGIAQQWSPQLKNDDFVLDIASNDNTLLNLYPNKVIKIGIDPSNIANENSNKIDLFANDFFSKKAYMDLTDGLRARIVTSIAMFYDLPDPIQFAKDVYDCLDDDGIWIIQLSYTPLMLEQNAFDNLVHEHLSYFTLMSLEFIWQQSGFKVLDVTLNDTNGGSCCVVLCKQNAKMKHVPLFVKQIGQYRYNSLLAYEKNYNYNDIQIWGEFNKNIQKLRNKTIKLLSEMKLNNKTIMGYGSSTKGNTLLQYYGISANTISAIADKQPQKHGKYTAGSWIPIISEEEMRKSKPDYLFIFPWHFKQNFLEREKELLQNGTKLIFPLPELEMI